jgi:hypothetical protein
MTELPGSASSRDAAAGAAEVWLSVCDDLLSGLSHALNNRLAAVGSIARVLEYGDIGGDSLYATLIAEIETLERTVALLRLVPRTDEDRLEPIRLEDFVPPVLRLHSLRRDVRDLEFEFLAESVVPPGFGEPVLLTRALLLALGAVSHAVQSNGGNVVSLESADGEYVTLAISGRTGGPLSIRDDRGELAAAEILTGAAGCHLSVTKTHGGAIDMVEIHLPQTAST